MQVSTRTKLHYNAREMRSFELSVERRQERMVKHLQNLPLHFSSLALLLQYHRLFVNHLHGVEARRVIIIAATEFFIAVPETAQIHSTDVAGADAAEELEITKGETGLAAERGGADG